MYTYRCGDQYTPSFWGQQFRILMNGLLNRNASGALIEVSVAVDGDLDAARRTSRRFFAAAVPYLDRNLP